MLKYLAPIAAAAVLAATASASSAAPLELSLDVSAMTIEVAGGCGPQAWARSLGPLP